MNTNISNYKGKDYTQIKKILNEMIKNNYQEYIKAILSIELNLNNKKALSEMYNIFMEDDAVILLNEKFIEMRENYTYTD